MSGFKIISVPLPIDLGENPSDISLLLVMQAARAAGMPLMAGSKDIEDRMLQLERVIDGEPEPIRFEETK